MLIKPDLNPNNYVYYEVTKVDSFELERNRDDVMYLVNNQMKHKFGEKVLEKAEQEIKDDVDPFHPTVQFRYRAAILSVEELVSLINYIRLLEDTVECLKRHVLSPQEFE